MPSSTVENYLKAILHLQQDGHGSTTVGEIARVLEVTPGTVTIMMRHLRERGLVSYEPRRGLSLKPRGVTEAMKVVRRHRLIETFLVEVMGLDWSEVHEEAEILEHVISDRLLDRINEMLGEPTHDPHGDPIPARDGTVCKDHAMPLVEADAAVTGWCGFPTRIPPSSAGSTKRAFGSARRLGFPIPTGRRGPRTPEEGRQADPAGHGGGRSGLRRGGVRVAGALFPCESGGCLHL